MLPTCNSMWASKRCGGIAFWSMTYRRPLDNTPRLTPAWSGSALWLKWAGTGGQSDWQRVISCQWDLQCSSPSGAASTGSSAGCSTGAGAGAAASFSAAAGGSGAASASSATASGCACAAAASRTAGGARGRLPEMLRVGSGIHALPSQTLKGPVMPKGSSATSDAKAQPSGRPSLCGVKAHCCALLNRQYTSWLPSGSPIFLNTRRPLMSWPWSA
mmetsp:Transcript_59064/g.164624  ORF Transcript_59064/g.164624 Transcript_59064/m.164624 type:complete len:216 (-) Transcript_59064:231-878(-)